MNGRKTYDYPIFIRALRARDSDFPLWIDVTKIAWLSDFTKTGVGRCCQIRLRDGTELEIKGSGDDIMTRYDEIVSSRKKTSSIGAAVNNFSQPVNPMNNQVTNKGGNS